MLTLAESFLHHHLSARPWGKQIQGSPLIYSLKKKNGGKKNWVIWWEWICKHTEAPAGGAESSEFESPLGAEFDAALEGLPTTLAGRYLMQSELPTEL